VGVVLACAILLAVPLGAGGAIEGAEEEPVCVGDSCQPLPVEPEDPTPGTLVPGPGNPPLRIFEPRKKKRKAHRPHRNGHRHEGRGGDRGGAAERPMR
jgi:hypothetical protein